MKSNLLKHIIIGSMTASVLYGCGSGESIETFDDSDIAPVTVNGDLNIVLTEDMGPQNIALLDGVMNPGETNIITRDFIYLKQLDGPDGPDGDDKIDNFIGPALPQGSVTKTENVMTVDPSMWNDDLVHPETLVRYPNIPDDPATDDVDESQPRGTRYTEVQYKFSYLLDNGAANPVTRNVNVTVQGVETPAESIDLVSPEVIEVPKGFSLNIEASVMPQNATFDRLIYTSENEDIATVSSSGEVSGIEFGDFTIVISSESGNISRNVTGTVAPLTAPVGIDIILDEDADPTTIAQTVRVPIDAPMDLDFQLLPVSDEVDFSDTVVEWASSDESKLTVDAEGLVTPIVYNSDPELDRETRTMANTVMVTATIKDTSLSFTTEVIIGPGTNLLASSNFSNVDFSNPLSKDFLFARSLDESPSNQLNTAIIEIRDDANSIDGPSLYVDNTGNKELRLQFSPKAFAQDGLSNDVRSYVLTFDIKFIEGAYQGWFQSPAYFGWTNTNATPTPEQIANGEVIKYWKRFNIRDGANLENGEFFFNFHGGGSSIVYIDNLSWEPLIE